MEINNQRGQIMMESFFVLMLFVLMMQALQRMATHQRQLSNKYKISQPVERAQR